MGACHLPSAEAVRAGASAVREISQAASAGWAGTPVAASAKSSMFGQKILCDRYK